MTAQLFTKQERRMLERAFKRAVTSLGPQLDAAGVTHPEQRKVFAVQNFVRGCMETAFRECLPYDQRFIVEVALRLAAYAITAAPHSEAEILTKVVSENLLRFVRSKIEQGAVIHTAWETDNVPDDAPPAGAMN